ncbi:MAG: sulfatase [Acidobacteria bacterium]|nr:sulfatase [Acidobacteriota bacterium]
MGLFAGSLLLAVLACVVAGAAEASARILLDPRLYDSRLDAASLVLWGTASGAGWGLCFGAAGAALLSGRAGVLAAACWPVEALAISALSSWLLRSTASPVWAARGALLAGMAGATLVTFAASRVDTGRRRGAAVSRWVGPGLAAAAVVALAPAAWILARASFREPAPAAGAPNILLVSIDTLRADAVGAFRRGRPHLPELDRAVTPRIDAEAARGVAFTEASTPLPKTPEALASLMTGLYPGRHGLKNLFSTLPASHATIASSLRARGWATRGVVANMLVGRWSGLGRGFDEFWTKNGLRGQVSDLSTVSLLSGAFPYYARRELSRFETLKYGRETGAETTDRAIRMLGSLGDRPWFLWVHYLDPHWPYWPPEPWRSRADTAPGEPFTLYDDVGSNRIPVAELMYRNTLPAATVSRAISLYAGEVSYTDFEVGRLLDAFAAVKGSENTLVVITADHGEALGEHGYYFSHGAQVYEPSIRIPMIVVPPSGGAGRTVATPVSLVDLLPTVLETAGVPVPASIDGRSLASYLRGGVTGEAPPAESDPVYSESDLAYHRDNPFTTIPGEAGKVRVIRQGDLKLIRYARDVAAARRIDPALGSGNAGLKNPLGLPEMTQVGASSPDVWEMFDLASDPLESRNLYDASSPRGARLRIALESRAIASGPGEAVPADDQRELLKGLESLGYIDRGGDGH